MSTLNTKNSGRGGSVSVYHCAGGVWCVLRHHNILVAIIHLYISLSTITLIENYNNKKYLQNNNLLIPLQRFICLIL